MTKDHKNVYCVYDKNNQIYWKLYKSFKDVNNREGHILQFDVSQRKYKAVVRLEDQRQMVLQLKDIVPLEKEVTEEKEKELKLLAEEYVERMQEKNAIFALSIAAKNSTGKKDKRKKRSKASGNEEIEEIDSEDENMGKRLRPNRRLNTRYAVSNSEEEDVHNGQLRQNLMHIMQNIQSEEHSAFESGKSESEYKSEIKVLKDRIGILENVLQMVFNNLQSGVKIVKKYANKK